MQIDIGLVWSGVFFGLPDIPMRRDFLVSPFFCFAEDEKVREVRGNRSADVHRISGLTACCVVCIFFYNKFWLSCWTSWDWIGLEWIGRLDSGLTLITDIDHVTHGSYLYV
jgi:hypothetical protein